MKYLQYVGALREGSITVFIPKPGGGVGMREIPFRLGHPIRIDDDTAAHIETTDEILVGGVDLDGLLYPRDWRCSRGRFREEEPIIRKLRILVRRNGALGDVICALAFIKGIRNAYGDRIDGMFFWTRPDYVGIAGLCSAVDVVVPFPQAAHNCIDRLDHVAILDGFPETDIEGAHRLPRIDAMMASFCGFRDDATSRMMIEVTPDFTLEIPEYAMRDAEMILGPLRDKPIIGVGLKASGTQWQDMKSRQMPSDWVEDAAKAIIENHDVHVFLLDGKGPFFEHVNGDRRVMGVPTDIITCLAVMKMLTAIRTVDSGLLWMSHCTETPLIAWLGPTPAFTRVVHHPGYKLGLVETVEMNDYHTPEIVPHIMHEGPGCVPCYETGEFCDRKFACTRDPKYKSFFIDDTVESVGVILTNVHRRSV